MLGLVQVADGGQFSISVAEVEGGDGFTGAVADAAIYFNGFLIRSDASRFAALALDVPKLFDGHRQRADQVTRGGVQRLRRLRQRIGSAAAIDFDADALQAFGLRPAAGILAPAGRDTR